MNNLPQNSRWTHITSFSVSMHAATSLQAFPFALVAERLSTRHLILQHALGQCMFVCLYVCMYVCMYICPSHFCTHARIEGPGVVACMCMKAEAGGWICSRSHAFSPVREAKLRERGARRRRTRRSASMQRVTKQQRQAGEGGEAETSCAGLHARPEDWAFQNQCAHLDSMLFTA